MTTEERNLLLQDLCARLPYGVKIMFGRNGFRWDWEQTLEEIRKCDDGDYAANGWNIEGIKPYLRPMSSMTEEEKEEYQYITERWMYDNEYSIADSIDWLNTHHFDFRGLIPKYLAIEVTEENNPYK